MQIAAGVLNRALKNLVTLVPKRSTLPVLENVLFEPTDNGIAITTTDLTTQARIIVPASDVFAAYLPARELLEFVASVDRHADIAILSHGDTVRLVAPGTTFELPQRPTAEFPKKLECSGKTLAILDSATFRDELAWVSRAVGDDETRPQLMGVLFDGDAIVGCDGHRLHRVVVDGLGCPKALVPANAIAMILRALKAEPIEISASKTTMRFSSPSCAITTRLIDEQYPAYQQVIPVSGRAAFTMKVDARELGAGLKRVSGRKQRNAQMSLRANGVIKLETRIDDVQRAANVAVFETTHDGPDHVQGFNPRYLIEALGDDDTAMMLRFYDAESPIVIDAGDRTAVVMPCRL